MMLKRKSLGFALAAVSFAAVGAARAMTLSSDKSNVVELLSQSSDIVVGKVASVTDGLDERGLPYTEVTLEISEAIRGGISGEYTFRQFGLLKPRAIGDGTKTLMPAPPGFPRYAAGEQVVVMLRPSARWTGFRMPAGISQGKFNLGPGRVENEQGNAGLFRNVRLGKGLATANDKRMMTVGGPANPDTFLTFLRRAVRERWVETGKLARADGRGVPRVPPPSEPNDTRKNMKQVEPPVANPPAAPLDPAANVAVPRAGR